MATTDELRNLQERAWAMAQRGLAPQLDTLLSSLDDVLRRNVAIDTLHVAAINDHEEAVRVALVHADVSPAYHFKPVSRALLAAASRGNVAIVELLLQYRDVNFCDGGPKWQTPLYVAAQNGCLATVQYLLTRKAFVDQSMFYSCCTPLYAAARHGCCSVVRALVQAKANLNARTQVLRVATVRATRLLLMAKADVSQCIDFNEFKAGACVKTKESAKESAVDVGALARHLVARNPPPNSPENGPRAMGRVRTMGRVPTNA